MLHPAVFASLGLSSLALLSHFSLLSSGGYAATQKWDPASGLGTFGPLTYQTLLERALAAKEAAAARRAAKNLGK